MNFSAPPNPHEVYVTDISQWQDVGRVHGEFFERFRPTTSMAHVATLIDPALLVETEADAYAPQRVTHRLRRTSSRGNARAWRFSARRHPSRIGRR